MSQARDKYLEINKAITLESEREKKHLAQLILQHYYDVLPLDIALNKEFDYNAHATDVARCIEMLNRNQPIQYILGETEFFGYPFKVNASVLIPRPETEELVDLVLEDNKTKERLSIIDIGTGSGCIPISLKKQQPTWNITAVDISPEALLVAKDNAVLNNVSINFILDSILLPEQINSKKFDILVSNPPYITNKEKALMHKNVLDYEPHLALFVKDHEPLLFYRACLSYAENHLHPGGKVYFEINEHYSEEMKSLCKNMNFKEIKLIEDLSGRKRIISCKKSD